jgi:hypothetical protein
MLQNANLQILWLGRQGKHENFIIAPTRNGPRTVIFELKGGFYLLSCGACVQLSKPAVERGLVG